MTTGASVLHALAEHAGILSEFVDYSGAVSPTGDSTRVALLAAMGIDASDPTRARIALAERIETDRSQILPPVAIATSGSRNLHLSLSSEHGPSVEWSLVLTTESGEAHRASGRARRHANNSFAIPLPLALPLGYHDVRLVMRTRLGEREAGQLLIVAPATCRLPTDMLLGNRVFGITANLYSVRSRSNWGAGNFGDLATLVTVAARNGAAFVGVNPLHALLNRGCDISPYSPVSRLFRNPLYLDIDAIPELEHCEAAREHIASSRFREEVARLRAAPALDYEAVAALERPVLDALHRVFVERRARDCVRNAEYERYITTDDRALDDFATFCALDEYFRRDGSTDGDWRHWPAQYRDPRSHTIAEFRAAHVDLIDYHRWIQFELDRQLGAAAAHARTLGLPIGIYQDLAIGSAPTGSDNWAFGDLFANGATVGAPPDPLALQGQNWGFPPINPHRLASRRYDYWIALLRGAMRHSGALRIDHVLGLIRQFWIPDGKSSREGAYVQYPSAELFAILALESVRSAAIVVGEDLGTVPEELPAMMQRWGVMSSRVLLFERDSRGAFRPPQDYPQMALTTATTHDLPTLAGFWASRDIELRAELGVTRTARVRPELTARRGERLALIERLRAESLLPDADTVSLDDLDIRAAVHAFLRRTPSWLVGIALDDLVGEIEPVNMPGVGPDHFSSWTHRLSLSVEDIANDPRVQRAFGVERNWVSGGRRE
ncbi:MAG: 4-alpha-glucanotransferase [Gemmatimonadaceae bacterium]